MIYIGAVYMGPELKHGFAGSRIGLLMREAIRLRGDFVEGAAPSVNPVFHVPGSLGDIEFEGLRDAKFSRQQKLLMVQIAVPREKLAREVLDDFLIESLHGANAIAFHYFRDRGMTFPLREAEKRVNELQQVLEKAIS